jgi:hypothetical protein
MKAPVGAGFKPAPYGFRVGIDSTMITASAHKYTGCPSKTSFEIIIPNILKNL